MKCENCGLETDRERFFDAINRFNVNTMSTDRVLYLQRALCAKCKGPGMLPGYTIRNWQIVVAELEEGKASVGIRFNDSETVQFFEMNQTPEEAVAIVILVKTDVLTLWQIAQKEWIARDIPRGGNDVEYFK